MAAAQIDFWFTMGSTYSFLNVMRLAEIERSTGIKFRWRPFHLLVILQEMKNVPFADKPIKSAYMWRDIERRAAMYGIPAHLPAPYPAKQSVVPNLVATIGIGEGWGADFCRAAYRRWFSAWARDRQRAQRIGELAGYWTAPGARACAGQFQGSQRSADSGNGCRQRTWNFWLADIHRWPRAFLGRRPARGRN